MTRAPITKVRSAWIETDSPLPQASAYRRAVSDGVLIALVAVEAGLWHLSISHGSNHKPPRLVRYPTWDEIADARERLLPDDRTFAMLLPPPAEYVAVHDTTFHLHEILETT